MAYRSHDKTCTHTKGFHENLIRTSKLCMLLAHGASKLPPVFHAEPAEAISRGMLPKQHWFQRGPTPSNTPPWGGRATLPTGSLGREELAKLAGGGLLPESAPTSVSSKGAGRNISAYITWRRRTCQTGRRKAPPRARPARWRTSASLRARAGRCRWRSLRGGAKRSV